MQDVRLSYTGRNDDRISLDPEFEINRLTRKFAVTYQDVINAVWAVGDRRENVEAYLANLRAGLVIGHT